MPQIAAFRGALGDTARDATRAIYRYHQVFVQGGRQVTRKSFVAAVRMAPWSDRQIRPHEATDPAERSAELAKIQKSKLHETAVMAGFRDAAGEIDRQFKKVDGDRPTFEHTSLDGTIHRIWRSQSAEILGALQKVFVPKKLHVLDGHGRYEAMLAYSDELDAKAPLSMYSSAKYAMCCLVNLDDVAVYGTTVARHRIVKGAVALANVKDKFIVEAIASRDPAKLVAALADTVAHQPAFVVALKGETGAYKLTLSPDVAPARQGVAVHRALQKLDPIVFEYVLKPAAFAGATVSDTLDPAAAMKADGDAIVLGRALPLDQLIHVDEINELLPAHSSAFAPAIAPKVTMAIDPDEDLQ